MKLPLSLLLIPALTAACASLPPAPSSGRQLATDLCAGCHSVSASGASPRSDAPPLRTLLARFEEQELVRTLRAGALMGHPTLPTVHLSDEGARDLVAYLKTLPREPAG